MLSTKVVGGLALVAAASGLLAAPAVASTAPATAPACAAAAVRVSIGQIDAGAGQRYAPLTITTTGATCTVTGTPSDLEFLDASGTALPTTPRFESSTSGAVVVGQDAPAHVQLHWSPIPVDGAATVTPAALSVQLPGVSGPVTAAWTGGEVDGNGAIGYGAVQTGAQ